MLKQASNLIFSEHRILFIFVILFNAFIFFSIATWKLPATPKEAVMLRDHLFNNDKQFFQSQEDAFKIFSSDMIPRDGISLILDTPYDHYSKNFSWLYAAQNYFAPSLINPHPNEPYALFYCSTSSLAASRLKETGYRPIAVLAEGKGLAGKIS